MNQRNFKYDLQAVAQNGSYFFQTISKLNSQFQIIVPTASVAHQGQLSWIWLQSTHHFLYSVRRKIPYLVKYVLVYVLYVVLCKLYSRQYTHSAQYISCGEDAQIREQMSGPDFYVLTVGFLALKKTVFSEKKKFFPKKKNFFFYLVLCNFS